MDTKNKVAIKNMEYTRYIGVRYAVALFLFTNLNWAIALFLSKSILVVLPLLLSLYTAFVAFEQIKLYSKKDLTITQTKNYLRAQFIINLFLVLGIFNKTFYKKAFPFMTTTIQGKIGLASIIGIGLLIAFLSIRKIKNIEQNKDRLYKEVTKFKKSLKVSEENGK